MWMRLSQAPPPMPPSDPSAGAMPPDMPPDMGMGAMPPPMMGGGMPPAPDAPGQGGAANDPSQRTDVAGPLDSVAKILYDCNINFEVGNLQGVEADELAMRVWLAYGGSDMGGSDSSKIGKRVEDDAKRTPEEVEKERSGNENSAWERLPRGKTIADITSLEELTKMMSGLVLGALKQSMPAPAQSPMPM